MIMLKLILILLLMVRISKQEVLTTVQGQIRGIRNDGFTSYVGIPYANVSYDGRFKGAGVAPYWTGIRESQSSRSSCSSSVEECLQLDVHVPVEDSSSPWPVLVWVPSGRGHYHPGMFTKEGVIVVHVDYRNGPVGFLCLDHEEIPGNAGTKDLILALRWVQDNIVAFRGSPAKVIVAGQSYGAAMVEAVMLSSLSNGLFHGVILQSGSVLSPWAYNYDAEYRAEELGLMLTDGEDSDDMVSAFMKADTEELMEKSMKLDLPYFTFGMCLEKELKTEERLLFGTPVELLSSSKFMKVPMIIGYNTDEGYIFKTNLKEANAMKKISKDMTFVLPYELVFYNEHEIKQVVKQIKDVYFNDNSTMAGLLAYHRDVYFVQHIYRSARMHAQASDVPVYMYQFSHASDLGVETEPELHKSGAAHSDELSYLFPDRDRLLEGDDEMVQGQLVKLWTNFIKHLNPTPSYESLNWEPLSPGALRIYDIGLQPQMRDFPYTKAMQLWEDIYEKYYYQRQDPNRF